MNSKKNLLDHDPNIVVAIDFDGTLTIESCVSDFFSYNLYAIEQAKKIKNLGVTLILWTCREGDILSQITKELKKYGLIFDFVNQGNGKRGNSRKVNADIYIDDRANDGVVNWEKIYQRIQKIKTMEG